MRGRVAAGLNGGKGLLSENFRTPHKHLVTPRCTIKRGVLRIYIAIHRLEAWTILLPASVQVCTFNARRSNIRKGQEVVFGVGYRTSGFYHQAVEPLQVTVSVIFTSSQVRLKECPARPLAIRVA
jgi:hypothetical protein